MVRPGKLHSGPRLVHDRAHSNPLCSVDRRRPGGENFLRKETPTIAEFFKKNGYGAYFSGKWHMGDKPESYPIEHGFDEMKNFAAYYAGVYTYDYTNKWFHPWFPSYNPEFAKSYNENVNLDEWEGVAGQPAKSVGKITYDSFATFDSARPTMRSIISSGTLSGTSRSSWT